MPAVHEDVLQEYERRINQVMDYIVRHLDAELSLEVLAEVACFSKFHFHRIFSALVGETVNEFVRRMRLEKAAHALVFDRKKSITAIALDCGFSSSQNFAKAFKRYFQLTPNALRKNKDFRQFETLQRQIIKHDHSKIGNTERNDGKDNSRLLTYSTDRNVELHRIHLETQARSRTMHVEVVAAPDRTVAYVRHIGPFTPELIAPIFTRLLTWAGPRDLLTEQAEVLGISWAIPTVTPEDKSRFDACLTVPDGFQPDETISVQRLGGGKCAVYRREVAEGHFHEPWIELIRDWLPGSGYQPDERPCYEIYRKPGDQQTPWLIDFCLPVKPL